MELKFTKISPQASIIWKIYTPTLGFMNLHLLYLHSIFRHTRIDFFFVFDFVMGVFLFRVPETMENILQQFAHLLALNLPFIRLHRGNYDHHKIENRDMARTHSTFIVCMWIVCNYLAIMSSRFAWHAYATAITYYK